MNEMTMPVEGLQKDFVILDIRDHVSMFYDDKMGVESTTEMSFYSHSSLFAELKERLRRHLVVDWESIITVTITHNSRFVMIGEREDGTPYTLNILD